MSSLLMQVEGVDAEGRVLNSEDKGKFNISSFRIGVQRDIAARPGSAGNTGSGLVEITEAFVTREADGLTSDIFNLAAGIDGKEKDITITSYDSAGGEAGAQRTENFVVTLVGAQVKKQEICGTDGGRVQEEITLYTKKVKYKPTDKKDGSEEAPRNEVEFDQTTAASGS